MNDHMAAVCVVGEGLIGDTIVVGSFLSNKRDRAFRYKGRIFSPEAV